MRRQNEAAKALWIHRMDGEEFENCCQRIVESQARLDRNNEAAADRLARLENLVTSSQLDMTKRFKA